MKSHIEGCINSDFNYPHITLHVVRVSKYAVVITIITPEGDILDFENGFSHKWRYLGCPP